MGAEEPPPYAVGDVLKFRFWREEDARYVFDAPVQSVSAKPPRWRVLHVESMARNQARAHYRVRFDETVTANVISASRDDDYTGLANRPVITQLRGRVTSLSGGGLAIVFQQPVPKLIECLYCCILSDRTPNCFLL